MAENMGSFLSGAIDILFIGLVCIVFLKTVFTLINDRYAPVKTEKAQVTDKYIAKSVSKYGSIFNKKPQYVLVFAAGNKKLMFRVSELSYNSCKVNKQGTLRYKGSRLIDFS